MRITLYCSVESEENKHWAGQYVWVSRSDNDDTGACEGGGPPLPCSRRLAMPHCAHEFKYIAYDAIYKADQHCLTVFLTLWLIFLPDGLGGLRHVHLQLLLLCFIVNTDFVQLNYDCNFVCVCKPMVWQFVWGLRDILVAKAFSSAVSIIIVIHGNFHTIFICISVWWIFFHCHLQNISSILVDTIILELSNMKYLPVHHFKYLLVKFKYLTRLRS